MKKTILLSLLLLPVYGLAGPVPGADPFEILEPHVFKADFEAGSVGPWSSYPPAQDTAYDPTLWVKKIEGHPGLCLVREINAWTPNEYIIGVRKKVDLYLTKDSRISFRFYVKSYSGVEKILVKLGFSDGSAAEIPIPVSKIMTWQDAVILLEKEIEAPTAKNLQAIAIMAVCRRADPEAKLRLAVDDLEISGFREKTVRIHKPAVHYLEEIGVSVAGEHFNQGQRITIEGEFPLAVHSGEVELGKGWENASFSRLKMRRVQRNLWTATAPQLSSGLWQAKIKGTTAQGNNVSTRLVFLVRPPSAPSDHPFLLITKADLAGIKEAIASGRTQAVWDKVRQGAAAFREKYDPADFRYNLDAYDEIFWLPTYEGYVRALHTPSQYIRETPSSTPSPEIEKPGMPPAGPCSPSPPGRALSIPIFSTRGSSPTGRSASP